MSGRLVPFAAALLLFALLPFLGGSTPKTPTDSVVLAAGSPAAVQDAVDAVGQARDELSALDANAVAGAPAGSSLSSAIGGGLFLFPSVSLAPVTADALMAPLTGMPFFIHPVPGGETSPFGPRIHPLLGRPMFHTGIDLAAACGTPILAAADGTVVYARVSASWGGRTIIQHTPRVKTAYGHQSKFLVTEGQKVKQGQVIGLSGTTGWSTGCHLHFDVIVDDRYVDPAPYLGFPPSSAASVPYAAVPQLVLDPGSLVAQTVPDGDVPISEASEAPVAPAPDEADAANLPAAPEPPTAPAPSTSKAVPSPTTTKPSPTSSTPTTTTSTPPATTPATTTSTPPPTGTPSTATSTTATTPPSTTPTTATTTATTTSPPATTTSPPSPTSTQTVTAAATATATEVLQAASQLAAADSATCQTATPAQTSPTTPAAPATTTDPSDPTCVDPSTSPTQ